VLLGVEQLDQVVDLVEVETAKPVHLLDRVDGDVALQKPGDL